MIVTLSHSNQARWIFGAARIMKNVLSVKNIVQLFILTNYDKRRLL